MADASRFVQIVVPVQGTQRYERHERGTMNNVRCSMTDQNPLLLQLNSAVLHTYTNKKSRKTRCKYILHAAASSMPAAVPTAMQHY